MTGIYYTIKLSEPVLANNLAGDTNSAQSLPYIPGGLIRGALITEHSASKKRQIDSKDEDFRSLFLNGSTRFLHAYPLQAIGRSQYRVLPASLSWKMLKDDTIGDGGNFYDLAAIDYLKLEPLLQIKNTDFEALKNVKFQTYWQAANAYHSREVEYQFNLHTQREAMQGRATEANGAVFRYEALPAGLLLRGYILTEDKNNLATIKNLLKPGDELWFGKSRTAGYGKAIVEEVDEFDPDLEWHESFTWPFNNTSPEEDDARNEAKWYPDENVNSFYLTFLSPAIVRDKNGHFTDDPSSAIAARLDIAPDDLLTGKVFRKTEVVGGFNRKWGLPLPQVQAISAGSVFVYELKTGSDVKVVKLKDLINTGIGERRAEGFGRVMCEKHVAVSSSWQKHKPELPIDKGKSELDDDSKSIAQLMLKRLLQVDLDKKLLDAIHDHTIIGDIKNNQISRWRIIIRDAMVKRTLEEKLDRLREFITGEEKKNQKSWKEIKNIRISSSRNDITLFSGWIKKLAENKENFIWLELGYSRTPSLSLSELVNINADDEMAAEYALRLLDGVLAKNAKGGE
ncbi:MAG: hypothetical protein DWQ05_16800 [Calditrichaeota bacterium]|nr:MAG: hypothetical protein DWQ05_16800 [Calditrichota bacterium]